MRRWILIFRRDHQYRIATQRKCSVFWNNRCDQDPSQSWDWPKCCRRTRMVAYSIRRAWISPHNRARSIRRAGLNHGLAGPIASNGLWTGSYCGLDYWWVCISIGFLWLWRFPRNWQYRIWYDYIEAQWTCVGATFLYLQDSHSKIRPRTFWIWQPIASLSQSCSRRRWLDPLDSHT